MKGFELEICNDESRKNTEFYAPVADSRKEIQDFFHNLLVKSSYGRKIKIHGQIQFSDIT